LRKTKIIVAVDVFLSPQTFIREQSEHLSPQAFITKYNILCQIGSILVWSYFCSFIVKRYFDEFE